MIRKSLIIGLIAGLCFSTQAYSVDPLRIAYPTFAPFHLVGEGGGMEGLFYDIITEAVEKRLGIPVTWTPYPWARCQENVKFGVDDAIITVPTRERAEYTKTHAKPFYLKELHLFTYSLHPELEKIRGIKTIQEIKTLDFSVITYSGNGWHKNNVQSLGIKTYESGSLDSVWKMLALKRGDLVIEWPGAAWPDLRRMGLSDTVRDTGASVSSMEFHLLIRSGSIHVSILDKFDAVIESMWVDGILSSIEKRYQ